MRKKIHSYLGFAKRSGNIIAGYNSCEFAMMRKKIKLLILTEDIAEGTKKKFRKLAADYHIPMYIYGTSDEVPQFSGNEGKGIFGITDKNFAQVIEKEILSELKETEKLQNTDESKEEKDMNENK